MGLIMRGPSVADQYRQEAARLRREAKVVVNNLFRARLIAVAREFEKRAAVSDERASGVY
jgi:hypothetical protein